MIRRVVIPVFGDVNVMEVRSGPPPALEPGTVRVRVAAAGVNFADLVMRMGLYPEAPPRPFVPGYEVSGVLTELSEEAARARPDLTPGMRVIAGTRFGGYAEEIVTPPGKVFPLPPDWSFEEGAAFPVTYITAWFALVAMARVRAGDYVLVHGITGGVGSAALQIARAAGAHVAGTCGGPEKARTAERWGAERGIDYRSEHVPAVVRAWAPDGVDIVLESRGGKGLRESMSLPKPTGRVVTYGVSEMASGRKRNWFVAARALWPFLWMNPLKLIQRNHGLFGLNVLAMWGEDAVMASAIAGLRAGAESGAYRPVLDRAFPLTQAPAAHRYLHERRNLGKVVLTTGVEMGGASGEWVGSA